MHKCLRMKGIPCRFAPTEVAILSLESSCHAVKLSIEQSQNFVNKSDSFGFHTIMLITDLWYVFLLIHVLVAMDKT